MVCQAAVRFGEPTSLPLGGWVQEQEDPHWEPKVSPYRLAAHLTSAFAIYATLVWTALGVAVPYPPAVTAGPQAAAAAKLLRRVAHPVAGLVGVTAVSGAFVAGLHAGLCYNTWPDMNGEFFPSEYFALPGGCGDGGWPVGAGWLDEWVAQ